MHPEAETATPEPAAPTAAPEASQATQGPVQLVAFCCFYCAYAAADLAGVMRLSYPPNVRVVLLPCTGGVDPLYILRAFEAGADGVFVAGCLEDQCHYQVGNLHARSRVTELKRCLDEVGVGGNRLEMFNLSSAQGPRFAEVARLMTERVTALGPSPLRRARKDAAHAGHP
jgi:coenzyme F420-reducing hydrogenase delta subunit